MFNRTPRHLQVLFLDKTLSSLTTTLHALTSLLYPLNWVCIYIPMLSVGVRDVARDLVLSPSPYVIGQSPSPYVIGQSPSPYVIGQSLSPRYRSKTLVQILPALFRYRTAVRRTCANTSVKKRPSLKLYSYSH